MVFLKFSPYFIISSFLTTLLLDRGVYVTGNRQFPTSTPWYPKANPSRTAKISKDETEALKKVLPLVTFDCRGKTGYFPDSKFNCEVFHYCQPDGSRSTFHCPAHQLFNQLSMVCEQKTAHNSRLCKEGSINPSKFQKIPNTKKISSSEKITPILKPSLNSSSPKDKKLMTLEDLLTYMNTEQDGRETEPTFISRFHKAEEPQKSTKLSESAITNSKKEIRFSSEKKPSKVVDVQLKAESSDQSFKITKSSSTSTGNSKRIAEEEEISAEYDAIEGRKYRKHKRVGRVLDVETDRQPKKENEKKDKKSHSHMAERSVLESPQQQENTTSISTSYTDTRNSNSPSLFQTDRNKARDIRKRKRYQGRKRKTTTPSDITLETEADLAVSVTTMMPMSPTAGQELDTTRNNAYKRRKSQRTRMRGDVHKIHNSEKVEPYTLPPLPTPEYDKPETTTQSIQKEETKNPWYKTTTPSTDEGMKFGEKISDLDQHYYQTDMKLAAEQDPAADFFGAKSIPSTSEELLSEEYRERLIMQSKHSYPSDTRSRSRSKVKKMKKYNEDDSDKHYEPPSMKQHVLEPADLFPPPRAEAREHHSTPPQEMMFSYDSHPQKSKNHSFQKATTEDPIKAIHSYQDKYHTELQKPKHHEDERWKSNLDDVKTDAKKVEVGSTFFFQNPAHHETTNKPKLQEVSQTESTILKTAHKEKEMPKHTLAQQHLSKIMNEFFAMSSPKFPGRVPLDSEKEEDMIVPEYRIPDEDIYTGSESVTEDVEDIPPELLEVVDLITGNVDSEKKNPKPKASHEIIKINGPITNSHLEKIFLDDKFDEEPNQQPSSDGSFKKIIVIPRPEDKEDSRDVEEVEEVTSLKLEQFLKQYAEKKPLKSLKVISLRPQPQIKHQPTILRAKKVPVRVIYRDQLATLQPKSTNQKPNIKVIRTHTASPRVKIISDGKRQRSRPITQSFSSYSQPQIILHPSSLFPPHPPPLPKKQFPLNIGYPFASNSRLHVQNIRQGHSRRKRSILSRLRRQIRQNQYFLPFSSPVYPSFNPKFVPTFSPFKPLFSPPSLHTSSSHLSPFAFPGYPKPPQTGPRSFRSSHSRPPPVRHISPTGHQAVIVEEVPVPVPVEVSNTNFLQPAPSGSPPSKLPPRYSDNQFRNPSPPAIQTPPLIQRPQNRFPPPSNNYRPFGMPSNLRPPPPVNPPYRSPIPLTGPLPPRITSDGQVFALGVTNKPILAPSDPRPVRPPNGGLNLPPRNLPRPYNPFSVHANSYPNFPYFQGAFTTPISNEPVAGRLMYSGYKPPKSTIGTRPPKTPTNNKDRKTAESSSSRSRSKPTQDYFDPPRPMRESHVSYTEEVLSNGRSRERPKFEEYPREHKDSNFPRQNSNTNPSSSSEIPRKRRPGRRRRPRPYTTTQGSYFSNDISPTPPPPEQIPPPPAEYTSKPAHEEILNSLPSSSEGTRVYETSSHFPPAGYYGKDQLVQFFDGSSKASKPASSKPHHHKSLGESRSNIKSDDSFTSVSNEDGNEPVFGTRLRSKPSTESRSRQLKNKQPPRLQTQKSEIQVRPSNKQEDRTEEKNEERKPANEGSKPQTQIRNERPPPRRRRPPPPRNRSRPPPMPSMRPQSELRPQSEVHHFNYNENMGNFYSVPRGLQNLVAPSANPQQRFRGSTDMFGLPHPVIDQSIYSLRPEGAPDFDPNFFSVPAHVAQQQQSPLHKMNVRPVPESVRDFFTAPETGSIPSEENSESDKKESESRHALSKSKGENEHQEPPVRKLRKPKRKNRYNPHSTELRDNSETNSIKSQGDSREGSTVRYREKPPATTTTTIEPHSTTTTNYQRPGTTNYQSQNDIKEPPNVFKQRSPLLPKALPELSKSLMNGKIDIQKLNATISTSVSVSGAIPQTNNSSSEEKENKRVFSSQNGGGLAVVRKGPKRKRARQRVSSTTGVPYVNNESNTDAKYEIAASVLDIIKATTETERQSSGHHDNFESERPSSSRVSNIWVESPSNNKYQT